MNDIQHEHDMNRGSGHDTAPKEQRPYWRHAHHDWRFWAAFMLMIGAISIYVLSDNFDFLFGSRPQTPISSSGGR
jgi:hypothetical protein